MNFQGSRAVQGQDLRRNHDIVCTATELRQVETTSFTRSPGRPQGAADESLWRSQPFRRASGHASRVGLTNDFRLKDH
jgi:hypothetical protein